MMAACLRVARRQTPKNIGAANAAPTDDIVRVSGLLYLLEHLENALRRADEHALERLRKATALERVAAGAAAFSHAFLQSMGGPGERSAEDQSLYRHSPHRCAIAAPANTPAATRGGAREYCGGGITDAPSSAAACHTQRGSHRNARAIAIMSASPAATIACACTGVVMSPTAIVVTPAARLIARAKST